MEKIVSPEVEKVGKIIRKRRIECNIKQTELARMIGCSTVTMNRIERGTRTPAITILFKLCQQLALSVEEVVLPIYPNACFLQEKSIKKIFPTIESSAQAEQIERIIKEVINAELTEKEFNILVGIIRSFPITRLLNEKL